VNKSAWEKLPRLYQQAIEAASAEANVWMTSTYDARNPEALDRLLANGVQLRRFPDDSLQEAEKISLAIMEERAAADATYNNVYTQWKKFRAQSYRWFNTTELAYASFAYPRAT
jgi:TRAP-type mannitol/chloroaromatic compound transport system substrate-binding protein